MPTQSTNSDRWTETHPRTAAPAGPATASSPAAADAGLPLAAAAPTRCCGLGKVTAVCVAVAVMATVVAAYFVGRANAPEPTATLASQLPPIDATGAVSSEQFSMATGLVTDEAEGLFVLDHNSGLLQCSVIYPRAGRFLARFTANVSDAFPAGGKGGQYIMTTGSVDFPRASNRPVGSCVVYVLDTATGRYACYGVPFDRSAMNTGRPQQGALPLLATGSANPIMDRDSLR